MTTPMSATEAVIVAILAVIFVLLWIVIEVREARKHRTQHTSNEKLVSSRINFLNPNRQKPDKASK